jgi:hypothetical protein
MSASAPRPSPARARQAPYLAYFTPPQGGRRTSILVVSRPSPDTARALFPDGRYRDIPASSIGRPRRSGPARVQRARLEALHARIQALMRGLTRQKRR